jgi:uncharacterized protein YndB with AHSA1/START domain
MKAEPYVASIHVDAEPERVFEYFLQPTLLTRWMGRRAVLNPRPGGEFSLDIYRTNIRGRYLEVDCPNRILFTWGHEGSEVLPPGASTVEVTFSRHRGGTLVSVEHRDLPAAERSNHDVGWRHFLPRLAAAGGGNDPGVDPWSTTTSRVADGSQGVRQT